MHFLWIRPFGFGASIMQQIDPKRDMESLWSQTTSHKQQGPNDNKLFTRTLSLKHLDNERTARIGDRAIILNMQKTG